jgi:hypothetical protein
MQSLLLWPQNPILSVAVVWLVSVVLLWAARAPMLDLLKRLGTGLDDGLGAAARTCAAAAGGFAAQPRGAAAAGSLSRAISSTANPGIDAPPKTEQANLHRRSTTCNSSTDYRKCGDNPPQVPG